MIEDRDAPMVKLVYAILLSALKKGARAIRIRPGEGDHSLVELTIGDEVGVEMRPPARLHPYIVRRIGVMANLPVHRKGEHASGLLHLRIREDSDAVWDVEVGGHGSELYAVLRLRSTTYQGEHAAPGPALFADLEFDVDSGEN